MILSFLLLFSLAYTLVIFYCTNWIQGTSDIWIIIVSLLVGFFSAVILVLLHIFIFSLFINTKKTCERPKKLYLRTVQRVSELLLMITRTKVYVRGMDKLPQNEKFLFITNHQSWFDAIVCCWTLRAYPVSFVLKKSLIGKFVLGKYLHACSYISLDRENAREGIKSINIGANKIKNNEASVLIFPEGTRSGGYEMGEFHNGSFKIATKANCPIVLCCLQNSFQVNKRIPFKSTNIYFDVIEVMYPNDYKEKTTQEIAEYAHAKIKNNLDELPKY